MKKTHLSEYFADYRPEIKKVLDEVLFLARISRYQDTIYYVEFSHISF